MLGNMRFGHDRHSRCLPAGSIHRPALGPGIRVFQGCRVFSISLGLLGLFTDLVYLASLDLRRTFQLHKVLHHTGIVLPGPAMGLGVVLIKKLGIGFGSYIYIWVCSTKIWPRQGSRELLAVRRDLFDQLP